jgi:aspartyl-tRNA(Asn)/glutamyl-tRNA(Gln) amidotransferase subunit B
VVQETRGWDESKQETFHQRFKEGSADYRYFPEPDLPKLFLSEVADFGAETIRETLPELPWDKRERLIQRGVSMEAAEILVGDALYAEVYEREISKFTNDKEHTAGVNILLGEVRGENPNKEQLSRLDNTFSKVIPLLVNGTLSSTSAKASIIGVLENGGEPTITTQLTDATVLQQAIDDVLAENGKAAAEFKAGKEAALQYLVGKAMQKTKGAGNPEVLRTLIQRALS